MTVLNHHARRGPSAVILVCVLLLALLLAGLRNARAEGSRSGRSARAGGTDGKSSKEKSRKYRQPYYKSEAYLEAHRMWIRWYNPSLDNPTVDLIARSILYYCHYYKVKDPRMVLAVIQVESNFRVKAVSRAGAQGLGQIMPAECMAQKINPWVPEQNIQATVRVLKRNLDRFSHLGYSDQIYNALAAYNAGYYAVLRYGGVPPYEETRNYVRKVVSTWRFICGLR
jgi:hypothetical protein